MLFALKVAQKRSETPRASTESKSVWSLPCAESYGAGTAESRILEEALAWRQREQPRPVTSEIA